MKTAVRLGAISPITGWPVWCGGPREPGMWSGINSLHIPGYLISPPNGVIHYNMPLSATNIRIVSVSIPYQSRIVSVSFPYRFRIVLLSFSYRSPIVLLSFSYWEAENNTETIRNRTEDERMRNGGTRVVNLTIIVNSYDNGKTQTNDCGCQHVIYRRQNPINSCRMYLGF